MDESMRIERASACDAEEIFNLYRSLIDEPYGTWSEEYPDRKLVDEDLAEQTVFVMRDAQRRIVSAIVMEQSDEFDGMAPWYPDVTRWIQLGRLGVAKQMQGQGVARMMLAYAMDEAQRAGYEAVRFLVGAKNLPAQRSYARFGFEICGETFQWDEHWLCYEKRLDQADKA